MNFTEFEMNFLRKVRKRIITEDMTKRFVGFPDVPDMTAPFKHLLEAHFPSKNAITREDQIKLNQYIQSYILNQIIFLAALSFLPSRNVLQDQGIEDEFIAFLKNTSMLSI